MNNSKNTKAFYNTEIPSDWDVKKLYEIADVRDGTHESPKYFEHGVKFLTSKNIKDGELDFSDVSFITQEDAENFNKRSKVDKGDILMFEPDFCIKNVGLIKPKNIDRYFLIQFYHSPIFQNYLARNLDGGIQKFVSLGGLRDIPIPLPPLPEQKAIAQVLSTADTAIHTTEKLIAQKELRKKWLMQQLLSGKQRLNGFGGEWKSEILGNVVSLQHGYQFRDEDFVEEGIPVIKIRNVIGYDLVLTDMTFVDESRLDEFKSVIIENGDLLMSLTGNIGRVVEVKGVDKPMFQNYRVGKFTPIDGQLTKSFLKFILSSDILFKQFNGLANQSAQANFGKQDMDKLKFSFPISIEEQTTIAQVLQAVDKEISLLHAKAEKLREQKKGLMQQLLTGKVRLKIN
jgi:type I restriction enzyme S subunit